MSSAKTNRHWNRPPDRANPFGRLAAAYGDPALLKFHLDAVGAAAGRAAEQCDPRMRVSTQDMVLTAGDYPRRTSWSGRCITWT
jgi:hypothetical protein